MLRHSYDLRGREYSAFPGPYGRFRYLSVAVPPAWEGNELENT
jgi:hypothetical protein